MSSLSSVELNFLVFRYLQESGFVHSAFNLGYEAGINKSLIDVSMVPPGALIKIVQKGLQYLEMEANMSNSEVDTEEDFSFFQPLDLISKSVKELQEMRKERKRKEMDKEKQRKRYKHNDKDRHEKPMETSHIPSSDVRILEGHTSEVCVCTWNRSASLLASGSGDGTARIWSIPEGSFKSTARSINSLILKHAKGKPNEKKKEVSSLDWNGEGTLLATGSLDGQARIWTENGELKHTLSKHRGAIFSVKWNKTGDYLLTGSMDKTAVVWDVKAKEYKQQFEFHSGPILDADWRNNVSFATSSSDRMIYLCRIGETRRVKVFAGHKGEVNCVRWDPTGSLLASCSDDRTVKIWNIKQNTFVHDLREHTKQIYTIRWSPTGPGSNNPNKQLTLASASSDSSVKLWDPELGKMLCSFNGHKKSVYSVAFSPNGEYIASGSFDKEIHIWSLKEGKLVKRYMGNGGIFEVCWNKDGNKIAACFSDSSVCVLDFRM